MSRTVRNLWHRKDGPHSTATFTVQGQPVFVHRGVEVYRHYGSYLHVFGDAAIADRSGVDRTGKVIDGILDGTAILPVFDAVAAHLRSNGFTPFSYTDADSATAAEWQNREAACNGCNP